MAHKSSRPGRSVRGKLTRPHDRGEKYVAPQFVRGEVSERPRRGRPGPVISRAAHRRRLERHGSAHDLIQKLDVAILKQLSGPGVH